MNSLHNPANFVLALYFLEQGDRKLNAHSFVPLSEPDKKGYLLKKYEILNESIKEDNQKFESNQPPVIIDEESITFYSITKLGDDDE